MFYYLIENHMQKFRHFGGKQNFTRKSHLRLCCTKPFNYEIQWLYVTSCFTTGRASWDIRNNWSWINDTQWKTRSQACSWRHQVWCGILFVRVLDVELFYSQAWSKSKYLLVIWIHYQIGMWWDSRKSSTGWYCLDVAPKYCKLLGWWCVIYKLFSCSHDIPSSVVYCTDQPTESRNVSSKRQDEALVLSRFLTQNLQQLSITHNLQFRAEWSAQKVEYQWTSIISTSLLNYATFTQLPQS